MQSSFTARKVRQTAPPSTGRKIKVFVTGEDQPAPPGSYPVDYLLFDSGRGDGIAPKDRQIPLVTDRFPGRG